MNSEDIVHGEVNSYKNSFVSVESEAMYVHFENWSRFARAADPRIPSSGHVIKAYASISDPRDLFDKKDVFTLEYSHKMFKSGEKFSYNGREGYSGDELENDLVRSHEMPLRFKPVLPLDELSKQTTRTLMRLMHSREFPVVQQAMLAKDTEGKWYFEHPFSMLHGFEKLDQRAIRSISIHLDIISPNSLELLTKLFDWKDEGKLLEVREGVKLREHDLQAYGNEGNTNSQKER